MEAMTEQGIKEAVFRHAGCNREGWCETCRLVLAWVEATARAEEAEFYSDPSTKGKYDKRLKLTPADWRQAVKDRIGWKD